MRFAPRLLAFAVLAWAPAALGQTTPTTVEPMQVTLMGALGKPAGEAKLYAGPKGVLIRVEVHGLEPGWHGMHLHAKGDCSDAQFTNAGAHVGHMTSGGPAHGLLNAAGPEAGDLPSIFAARDGVAMAEVYTDRVTLADLKDADGSALVVHAQGDNQIAQPIGGAGPRIACGVIK